MQKYKFPLLLPPDTVLTLTQGFGPTDNTIEPAGPHGEPHFHYGVDVVCGSAIETYGTPIVCPFESSKVEAYEQPPCASLETPFIKIAGEGASGNKYDLVLAHVSAIFFHADYTDGTIVGLVGNYGMVAPTPTPAAPFDGSHLHLGLLVDGKWADPLEYFDILQPYVGAAHDPQTDVPRLAWALDQLKAQLAAITGGTSD